MQHRTGKSQGIVRVGALAGLIPVACELGVDPEEILERFGYTAAQFDDPDLEIPYVTAGQLLACCVKSTQCPHFGLLAATHVSPSTLGIPGFLLQNAPDVGTALRELVQNLDLHDQGGAPFLDTQGKSTLLGYRIHQVHVEASEQIYDLSIAVGCNIMRRLCGADWNPMEACLSRSSPPELKLYRRFYRAPLRFNMELNALVFPSRWLHHKISNADALLHHYLEREADARHRLREPNIIKYTRRFLQASLMNGDCAAHDIAKQLCMHERTLHRRLHEKGTSFQRERDAVRDDIARQLLTNSAMPIVKIATTLHYSSVSAFNRAFKRWTGSTPARWRSENAASSEE